MKPAKSNASQSSGSSNGLIVVVVLLVVVLSGLFHRSFLPDYVHFSNDGPLGQQVADWPKLPAAFTGSWYDLNDIGYDAGVFSPSISSLFHWFGGPIVFAKFYPPMALAILGLGAWTFFRQLKLAPLAAILGALAAALNSTFFSDACWGVASHQIAFGMDFFALALIVSNTSDTPLSVCCARLALAGLAVGMNVIEAADIGAIFSLFIAAFALFQSLIQEGAAAKKFVRGGGHVAVVAIFAAFIAAQTITALVATNIQGIVGTQQDEQTKAEHWDFATQWSFPKIETLGIVVPGLFGYKMDTPGGGNYWGAIGREPAWDRYFANGRQGSPPAGSLRFSGDGYYAGALVVLVALWAIAQLFRRQNSAFPETQRRFLWFWAAVLIISLPLSFGRFAPFYALIYKLPYFSTIRNPNKFLFVFSWALVIIFAYGIHGLSRRFLEIPAAGSTSPLAQLKSWWNKIRGFDRNWTSACAMIFAGSLLAWAIYGLQKPALAGYLQTVGFDADLAKSIAAFSTLQVGWFVLFFALAAGLFTFILSGAFAGRRARWAGILLGALLVVDLGRANLPWIVYWDYKQKYDVDPNDSTNSTNPIINFLRDKPYEHRVAYFPPFPLSTPSQFGWFEELYKIEWAQHHFPYYNIQSLDIIQMPRVPVDLEAYQRALTPRSESDFYLIARRWQLTNTRYLLGAAGFLDALNQQFDPLQQRFRIVKRFEIEPKPGIEQPTEWSQMTAVPDDNGKYALFEFTGALPRAKLYSHWQADTNDTDTLQTLAAKDFDAEKTVLVSSPLPPSAATNENAGTVEFKSYAPKDIVFDTQATAPSILLLNDKFDPNWRAWVDGKPAELLRCNFIMRGVYLTPGAHTVEFRFALPNRPLYITLTALAVGMVLAAFLIFSARRTKTK